MTFADFYECYLYDCIIKNIFNLGPSSDLAPEETAAVVEICQSRICHIFVHFSSILDSLLRSKYIK